MKGIKLMMIAAEAAALIGIAIALFKCASDNYINYEQAFIVMMLSVVAVGVQSIQQQIRW